MTVSPSVVRRTVERQRISVIQPLRCPKFMAQKQRLALLKAEILLAQVDVCIGGDADRSTGHTRDILPRLIDEVKPPLHGGR